MVLNKQAPPGPPPRPNLTWKPSTHRWIRPKEVEEQFKWYTDEKMSPDEIDDMDDFVRKVTQDTGNIDDTSFDRAFESLQLFKAMEREDGETVTLRGNEGGIEGAAQYSMINQGDALGSVLYINYLASHPKNIPGLKHPDKIRGAGSTLVIKLAQEAVDNDADTLLLDPSKGAVGFYEGLGFEFHPEITHLMYMPRGKFEELANTFDKEEIQKDDYPEDPLGEGLYEWIENQLQKDKFKIEGALPRGSKTIGKNVEAELYNSFNDDIESYIQTLSGQESESEVIKGIIDALNTWSTNSVPIATTALEELFRTGYTAGFVSAGGALGQDFNPQALKIIEDGTYRIGDRIVSFGDEATKRFADVIHDAYTSELDFSLPAMTDAMREKIGDSQSSLERIARTETSNVSMLGRLAQWANDPDRYIYEYNWNMAPDNRVRDMKRIRAKGNPYTFDEILFLWTHNKQRLPNGVWQMGVINCRCSVSRRLRGTDFKGNRFESRTGQYEKTVDFDLDVLG